MVRGLGLSERESFVYTLKVIPYFVALLLPLTLLGAEMAEILPRIRQNDLAWLKQQPAAELVAARDARQNTPLIWASSLGSLEAVQILLDAGANPNEVNALGLTPLIAAAPEAAKVKALLAAGALANTKSKVGQHALAVAASSARGAQSVRLLLAAGAAVNEPAAQGVTPLLAALGGSCYVESVRLLLAAGSDVKAIDGGGFGAAHGAIACSPAVLKDILQRGANVNQQNTFAGKVRHGDIQLKGLSPLMLASAHFGPAIVRVLLDAGAQVNARDVRGMTPLLFAVSSEDQNAEVVRLLLAKSADRALKDASGEDALAWARKFNSPAVLKLLGAKSAPKASAPTAAAGGPGLPVALKKLEQTNEQFFQETGCGGCHHSTLLSFAASRAQRAGLIVQAPLVEARRQRVKGQFSSFLPGLQQMQPLPGDVDSAIYGLLEAQSLGLERSIELETLARYLQAKQLPDGSWSSRGISRSPIEEADLHRTALALWLVPQFSAPAAKPAVDLMKREALRWIEARPALTSDERAMKLLGLKWGAAAGATLEKAARALAALQNADGSWGGNRHLSGDAYSTGLALFALREAAAAEPKALAKAALWLRTTQHTDGTWFVKSRAPKFQPYFESGFPYGPDQWISAAATAWAVAALSEAGGQ